MYNQNKVLRLHGSKVLRKIYSQVKYQPKRLTRRLFILLAVNLAHITLIASIKEWPIKSDLNQSHIAKKMSIRYDLIIIPFHFIAYLILQKIL